MAVIPQRTLDELIYELKEVKQILTDRNRAEADNEWVESAEARKLLGVSQRTWQYYRDKKIIPFSQFGRKIFVRRADLNSFMEKNYIQAE